MSATIETGSLAEAREAAFDTARDLEPLLSVDAAALKQIDACAEDWAVTRAHLDKAVGLLVPSPVRRLDAAMRRHARELALSQRPGELGQVPKPIADELVALADKVNRLAVLRRAAGTLEDDVFTDMPSFVAEQRLSAARKAQQRLAGAVADARAARGSSGLLDSLERIEAQKAEPDPPRVAVATRYGRG